MAVLFTGIDSKAIATQLMSVLITTYPKDFNVFSVVGGVSNVIQVDAVDALETSTGSCLYVPPLGEGTSFESFAEIVAHLRAPDGCPWDKEQTHESLRKHLLEETYEAITAIDSGDFTDMQEEFGDLLLQIVLHAQIANEENQFSINQVMGGGTGSAQ